jgi:tetratricopeptide (TPR) repeat protein
MTKSNSIARPQPVGILPIPAGLLLLTPLVGRESLDAGLQRMCLEGDPDFNMADLWPFYDAARRGDLGAAIGLLEQQDTSVAAYNRFVLNPSRDSLEALRYRLDAECFVELRHMLDLAAYALGVEDAEPDVEGLDGELLAMGLMAQAAAEMERESPENAMARLGAAVAAARGISPLFAAQLLGQLGAVERMQPEPLRSEALVHYREAISLIGNAKMPEVLSDLWMQLGMLCQETATGRDDRMTEAARAYQEVLRSGLVAKEHAELFALAHNNLGLLYLSMRMSEGGNQLRMAIAVQSFREALRICDREAAPDLWTSIQLNLANSLQYLTSSHPEENLVQAVELYEELITQRKKAFDPVGYGRILTNQANALAHLGIFPPALEKLQEARKLFEWHEERELAASAMELVGQIHEQVGVSAGGR